MNSKITFSVEVTEELLEQNPQLAEAGIEVGQTLTVETDRPQKPPHNG